MSTDLNHLYINNSYIAEIFNKASRLRRVDYIIYLEIIIILLINVQIRGTGTSCKEILQLDLWSPGAGFFPIGTIN